MVKIWHPEHGFVFSGDDAEIKRLLDSGGEIYVKKKAESESKTDQVKTEVKPVKVKKVTVSTVKHKDVSHHGHH